MITFFGLGGALPLSPALLQCLGCTAASSTLRIDNIRASIHTLDDHYLKLAIPFGISMISFSVSRILSVVAAALLLAACGGGEKGEDDSAGTVRSTLDATNISSNGFPWGGQQPGVLKRWSLPIPVKLNGDSRAVTAVDEIERQLGQTIFDRASIASTPDDQVVRGLIVSKGTSYVPPGSSSACDGAGGVAGAPNSGGYPTAFLKGAEISARLYVNLDNPGCVASQEVTTHEFGHALGMGQHYDGFGNGQPISPLFWRVLRTMYANPIGTPSASIVVQ